MKSVLFLKILIQGIKMFNIVVDRECGCFKRSELTNNISVDSKDEALTKSLEMKEHMNEKFCGKHGFSVAENGNTFIITMGEPLNKSSECCGGGCGTH